MSNDAPSRRGTLVPFAVAAFAASALTACPQGNSDPAKDPPPRATGAPAAVNTQAGAYAPAGNPPAANTPAANTPAAINPTPPPAAAGPNGRSAVPTLAEWTAQTKEVGVKGSSKLNCETKMVREWLRISCRGKNDTGGEPTGVTITKGGRSGENFTFAASKVASLVTPFVNGTDLTAEFTWTDKKMELHVYWPHGAPEPPLKGEFR
jgi:hypothetical protein